MSEKRGRGQPKFEPTQDQRSQVKLMKALGIPEDRICKTITNPRSAEEFDIRTVEEALSTSVRDSSLWPVVRVSARSAVASAASLPR